MYLGTVRHFWELEHIEQLLIHFQRLGCNISIELHYFYNHLDCFPEILGDQIDEQGEHFNQDIFTMEISGLLKRKYDDSSEKIL